MRNFVPLFLLLQPRPILLQALMTAHFVQRMIRIAMLPNPAWPQLRATLAGLQILPSSTTAVSSSGTLPYPLTPAIGQVAFGQPPPQPQTTARLRVRPLIQV